MTKKELREVYESRNWSEFSDDDIVGILDYLDDEDEDTIVDGYIKSSIKLLKKKIVEQSKYLKFDNIYKYVKKLSKAVEELEEILIKKVQTNKKEQVCSICGKPYTGYGNNAQPINDGRCCDECNAKVVIPKRIQEITLRRN